MNDQTIVTDDLIEAIEAEAPQQEPPMAIVVTDIENGKKVFKPHGEEFTLAGDFAAIAAALNLPTEAVTWSIEDDAIDGIDGKSLVGRVAV